MIQIYSDGACKGNPGIGSWAYVLLQDNEEVYDSGVEPHTTNNRMELRGVIEGLASLNIPNKITLFVDSQYVKNGCETWMKNWIRNGWKTASKEPVKNKDLWIRLNELLSFHEVSFTWVKGHSGNKYNDKADALANEAISNYLK
jgi:ribonuclease HI